MSFFVDCNRLEDFLCRKESLMLQSSTSSCSNQHVLNCILRCINIDPVVMWLIAWFRQSRFYPVWEAHGRLALCACNYSVFTLYQPETVVVELVVWSHGNETTPGTTQRVEDLRGGISPHLHKQQSHMQMQSGVAQRRKRKKTFPYPAHLFICLLM